MHEQVIYFGAPGTGKSYLIKEKLKNINSTKIFRVTIHPEFLYTDFVGQLIPNTSSTGSSFIFKEGPFTKALMEAYNDSSKDVYLVLEELSRGNVSAIFGDIFQLLDRDEHFVSKYPIRNKDISDKIPTLLTDEVVLPSNFNILCTVNMNDQSVFPMDTAFKRRFDWKYISTEPALKTSLDEVDTKLNNPKVSIAMDNDRNSDIDTNWLSFYTTLNSFITDKQKGLGKNEDKQVGQFFLYFSPKVIEDSYSTESKVSSLAAEKINDEIKNKLLNYLWQDVQGQTFFNDTVSLFAENINSFDDLYKLYGKDKVFSDIFIDEFLKENLNKYKY